MERDDQFVREEEAAAAAEAREIGGNPGFDPTGADPDAMGRFADPAFRAVEEGGGGVAEGFELSEALLEERATNPEGPSPWVDREQSVDEERAAVETADQYGEPDHFQSAQVREEQLETEDDTPGTSRDGRSS
jgi:hypothetical protein